MFVDMLIFQRRKYFTSVSINRFFNDINHWIFVHPFLEASDRLSSTKYLFYKNFPKFVEKHLCWNLCFNRLRPWGMQLYQNRYSGTEYCPVNITNTFFTENPQEDCLCISIWIVFNKSFSFLACFWSSAKESFFVCSEAATGSVL